MLRLIHVSDIHFGGYGASWDEDEDQRSQLIEDARELSSDQAADGILVGGDIAFGGRVEEYERAAIWLKELANAAHCHESAIWMVPGNHDVDRSSIQKSHILNEFREAVRTAEIHDLDPLLRNRLHVDSAGSGLARPLKAYNDFAKDFGCRALSSPLPWYDEALELEDRKVLLWGLNSAIVSDRHDADPRKAEPNMILGTHQCRIKERPGQIRVALCHHPPAWIKDWVYVEPFLKRADLVLFGHEHQFDAHQEEHGGVHVHAGAVGPDRSPGGLDWVPSYNLIDLDLDSALLHVSVMERVWSPSETRFVVTDTEERRFEVDLDRRSHETRGATDGLTPTMTADEAPSVPATPLAEPRADGGKSDAHADGAEEQTHDFQFLRALAVAYMSAPTTRRLEIAEKLQVLRDDDPDIEDQNSRFVAVLTRIREEGKIDQLAKELQ